MGPSPDAAIWNANAAQTFGRQWSGGGFIQHDECRTCPALPSAIDRCLRGCVRLHQGRSRHQSVRLRQAVDCCRHRFRKVCLWVVAKFFKSTIDGVIKIEAEKLDPGHIQQWSFLPAQ